MVVPKSTFVKVVSEVQSWSVFVPIEERLMAAAFLKYVRVEFFANV